jgi:hypothetical protein
MFSFFMRTKYKVVLRRTNHFIYTSIESRNGDVTTKDSHYDFDTADYMHRD